MRYKMGTDFDGVVQRYAQQNPRLGVIPHSDLCRSGSRKQQCCSGSLLKQPCVSTPGSWIWLSKELSCSGRQARRKWQPIAFSRSWRQNRRLRAALNLQLAIQHDNGDEAGFMETFSKSLGDTIPTTSQLNALYRAGELHFTDRTMRKPVNIGRSVPIKLWVFRTIIFWYLARPRL